MKHLPTARLWMIWLVLGTIPARAQLPQSYADSLALFRQDYMAHHDVIRGADTAFFRFFAADPAYRVRARFEKTDHTPWFRMETSGPIKKIFRVYGLVHFSIHDTALQLAVYQSQDLMQDDQYRDYLFLPFTDLTTGQESYATGRYLDFRMSDIRDGSLVIDFNKAYNPNCAYVVGKYNCPVPPRENELPVAIRAGEMAFGKKTH
ncbi:MAG TPA: DUF1684 domain-containing protein [Chitinophagaceae bacterium]|nr:DUF1684 domain-containing protein [Chitinophagaceae bacterium]